MPYELKTPDIYAVFTTNLLLLIIYGLNLFTY